MTKTHRVTKITALVLTFIMLFSVVCIAGTASAGAVTSTDMVSLYSAGINFSKYGNSEFIVYIKTTHVARFQRVLVHYHFFNGEWRDAYADCIKTFDDGSKIWKATFNSYDCVYAIRYEGDGKVAWDNNNGKDYSYDDVIGPGAAVESERLHNQYTMSNYQINAVLQNYAYHKEVFVTYTTDGWKTCQNKPLSYRKTNANGTETCLYAVRGFRDQHGIPKSDRICKGPHTRYRRRRELLCVQVPRGSQGHDRADTRDTVGRR